MARLSLRFLSNQLHRRQWQWRRNMGRVWRRVGPVGIITVLAIFSIMLCWVVLELASKRLADTQKTLLQLQAHSTQARPEMPVDRRQRLSEFEAYLPSFEVMNDILQDMFLLATDQGVRMYRGEYQVEPDLHGQFVRHRMNLPIQGDVRAIYAFIQAALQAHQSLALESVKFRRESMEAGEVDARIQWIILTQRPAGTVSTMKPSAAP